MSFCFKQFYVHDEQCAMKVGTDGVLLGAWAASFPPVGGTAPSDRRSEAEKEGGLILDIGTGSGLIALMLAQRFPQANILGIDIEENAVNQANENFAASPWHNRLQAEKVALQDMQSLPLMGELERANLPPSRGDKRGAIIVSNPPYFHNSLKAPNAARSTARHTDTLSYEDLLYHSNRLLADDGVLSLILPIEAEQSIIQEAAKYGLYPTRLCRVRGNERKPFKRLLIEFQRSVATTIEETTLTLEDAPNQRSEAYKALTSDFYL